MSTRMRAAVLREFGAPLAVEELDVADLREKALALWRKRSKRWLTEINQRVRDRHRAQGEVAFLLEPDLKEGRGGLRAFRADPPCAQPASRLEAAARSAGVAQG